MTRPRRSDQGDERPSKSQRKREMDALQELGEQLLDVPPAKLRELPIGAELIEAVELAQRIRTSREGLRRQRQYIGRLMRSIDPGPLRDALAVDGARHRADVGVMHAAERWRERLLDTAHAEADALAALEQAHPGARERVAALVRQVRSGAGPRDPKDGSHQQDRSAQASRAYRALYRSLRDIVGGGSDGPGETSERERHE